MIILRYPISNNVISNQDTFLDILDWLGFLTAKDYLVDLLMRVHHLPTKDAILRADKISPHIYVASGYIRQSLDGPSYLSFLPAYYAILNLMKVYILVGSRHMDLPKNRLHGATYDVQGKDSHSVLNEFITLKKNGVFPLFYHTVTGKPTGTKEFNIQMKDILPFVAGITHEYKLASGQEPKICTLLLTEEEKPDGVYPQLRVISTKHNVKTINKNQLRLLRDFHKLKDQKNVFLGKRLIDLEKKEVEIREQLNTYLIYRMHPEYTCTPVSSMRLQMPEEFPIALLFFYMSSIVRYKPEFFARLRDSRFWPVIASARTHSFHAFLLSFWSFMHQENYFINQSLLR